jgi:hypothetical protein
MDLEATAIHTAHTLEGTECFEDVVAQLLSFGNAVREADARLAEGALYADKAYIAAAIRSQGVTK